MSDQGRTCATCRHWGRMPRRIDPKTGEWEQPDGHACRCLFVVTSHVWQTPFEKGDVVTHTQVERLGLDVDVLRAEPTFGCRAWNSSEDPLPERWAPAERWEHIESCRCPWCFERRWEGVAA